MDSEALEKKFRKAVWLIRNGPPADKTTNEKKLKFYAYYKQATEGDVKGTQPWLIQVEARAKWDAWAQLKGMSREEAMQKYIELISTGKQLASASRKGLKNKTGKKRTNNELLNLCR